MTWLPRTHASLTDLLTLPPGWDSYGSPPVTEEAVRAARLLLRGPLSLMSRPPQVVPVSGGGLVMRWGEGGGVLEVEVGPEGSVEVDLGP